MSESSDQTEQIRKQYDELAQLAGSLAHEIKNPLSVIRMNMDLLAEDLSESDLPRGARMLKKVGTVRDQCTRLENLLNDFLRFARLRDLTLKPGNLNELVERVLELFAPQAHQQGVDIQQYLDSDLAYIKMDSETLHAAILNLVKNALEAMPEGGQLTVRSRSTKDGIALDLIDTGCGMDDETTWSMFKTFYTTKQGGSGLGLPTARKVIEAHGGRITVKSEIDRGTWFILEFPTPKRLEST